MNPRKGLKRVGLASYEIKGTACTMMIRRNGARCYLVAQAGALMMPKFFTHTERTLTAARSWAEHKAGK